MRRAAGFLAVGCVFLLLAGGSRARGQVEMRWRQIAHVPGAVDVAGPRADGRMLVEARAGLFLLRRSGSLSPFARGPNGYIPARGEAYIAVAQARRVPGAGCSFRRDDVYALAPVDQPGVTLIARTGRARKFVTLPAGSFLSSIAYDGVGRFGNRLLVTAIVGGKTTLYAFDCRGRSRVLVSGAARVEGGSAVAPRSFGRFGGSLIAVDEFTGSIYAFDARGRVSLVARPKLPTGQDIGIESVGFVPSEFSRRGAAYVGDLGAPGSPTVGTDTVLTVSANQLRRAGVRAGDLLVATEGGGLTIAVRCLNRCVVRTIGRALDATHGEGHIAFTR